MWSSLFSSSMVPCWIVPLDHPALQLEDVSASGPTSVCNHHLPSVFVTHRTPSGLSSRECIPMPIWRIAIRYLHPTHLVRLSTYFYSTFVYLDIYCLLSIRGSIHLPVPTGAPPLEKILFYFCCSIFHYWHFDFYCWFLQLFFICWFLFFYVSFLAHHLYITIHISHMHN